MRQGGFRFSGFDLVVLILAGAAAAGFHALELPLSWIVILVVIHFFLFCNVFLVRRRLELLWAAAFLLNVGTHLLLGRTGWLSPTLCQLPLSVFVIWREIRSPAYRGIFAGRLRPGTAHEHR